MSPVASMTWAPSALQVRPDRRDLVVLDEDVARRASRRSPGPGVRTIPPLMRMRSVIARSLPVADASPSWSGTDVGSAALRSWLVSPGAVVGRPGAEVAGDGGEVTLAAGEARRSHDLEVRRRLGHRRADPVGELEDEPEVLGGEVEGERRRASPRARGTRRACSRRTGAPRRWPRRRRRPRPVDAGLLGQHERLGDRLVEPEDHGVDRELHGRAGAQRTDVEDRSSRGRRRPAAPAPGRPPRHRP